MHKAATMVALVALLTVVVAGVALAVTKTCTSVPCRGTSADDVLKERNANGERDIIFGVGGNDLLTAERFPNNTAEDEDTDKLHGGQGNDQVRVRDGDFRDLADGGPGNHDVCRGDDERELSSTCEVLEAP
jgi:hypothetical protein